MLTTTARKEPFKVTAQGGKVTLLVMDAKDGIPAAFALMATVAEKKVAIRISGGCKNMTVADKEAMISFFLEGMRGFKGLAFSGATRQTTEDGMIDPMVTDVPGAIAAENPGCVALGTAPRTDLLTLQKDSRLVLDSYGTSPNPDMKGILLVQDGAEGKLDWDGDLPVYFTMMEQLRSHAGFTALGLISWNGGEVTRKEIIGSVRRGWPTILIRGSGRVTDEIICSIEKNDFSIFGEIPVKNRLRIVVVDKGDAQQLHSVLSAHSFL